MNIGLKKTQRSKIMQSMEGIYQKARYNKWSLIFHFSYPSKFILLILSSVSKEEEE